MKISSQCGRRPSFIMFTVGSIACRLVCISRLHISSYWLPLLQNMCSKQWLEVRVRYGQADWHAYDCLLMPVDVNIRKFFFVMNKAWGWNIWKVQFDMNGVQRLCQHKYVICAGLPGTNWLTRLKTDNEEQCMYSRYKITQNDLKMPATTTFFKYNGRSHVQEYPCRRSY